MAKVTFHQERVVEAAGEDRTLLEISLSNGIPHMCACGGFAKCSTCRILVVEGGEYLSEPTPAEWKLSAKKGFDSNIRLACQTKARGDVTIRRLVVDEQDVDVAISEDASERAAATGHEQKLAVLFTDIRDFTPFVDANLPYDVIHLLDRFFRAAGEAVIGHGGFIDKYMGDGMMALFGLGGGDSRTVCRSAIGAGLEITRKVEELDAYTRKHFGIGFKAGVGIHYGPALVGVYGHPAKMQFSAIGDTVNVASRVESATKQLNATGMLVSDAVFEAAENDVHIKRVVTCPLKGKDGDHVMYHVDQLLELPWATLPEALKLQAIARAARRVVTRRTAALFLRLSYHDAITYDTQTGEGGADGSIRFADELSRPESRGLDLAIRLLEPVKAEVPHASWGDVIAVAGAAAVTRAGGPEITVRLGRKDATAAVRDGLMPNREWGPAELRAYFTNLGFPTDLYTALSGAHTLGRIQGRGFTEDPYTFDNSYFRMLMRSESEHQHVLATDRALVADEQCAKWVREYAFSQDTFFEAFTEAYLKLTEIGMA